MRGPTPRNLWWIFAPASTRRPPKEVRLAPRHRCPFCMRRVALVLIGKVALSKLVTHGRKRRPGFRRFRGGCRRGFKACRGSGRPGIRETPGSPPASGPRTSRLPA